MPDNSHKERFIQAFYHQTNKRTKSGTISELTADYFLNKKHTLGLLNSFQAHINMALLNFHKKASLLLKFVRERLYPVISCRQSPGQSSSWNTELLC